MFCYCCNKFYYIVNFDNKFMKKVRLVSFFFYNFFRVLLFKKQCFFIKNLKIFMTILWMLTFINKIK